MVKITYRPRVIERLELCWMGKYMCLASLCVAVAAAEEAEVSAVLAKTRLHMHDSGWACFSVSTHYFLFRFVSFRLLCVHA